MFTFKPGHVPVLLSMPHNGQDIPAELAQRMYPYAQLSPDTDWFLDLLYDGAESLGVSIIHPRYSRYVVDLNRPPDDQPLYPGASNTGLCPTTCFDYRPIYQAGQEFQADELPKRLAAFWQPYHRQVAQEMARLYEEYGVAVLFDAHSIGSHVPRFFEGQLPDLNLGTVQGQSCSAELESQLVAVAQAATGYSWVLNGRFQGGYITRHYAHPAAGFHTFQLELSQRTYLNESTLRYDPLLAAQIKPVLQQFLSCMVAWAKTQQCG